MTTLTELKKLKVKAIEEATKALQYARRTGYIASNFEKWFSAVRHDLNNCEELNVIIREYIRITHKPYSA